VFNISVIDEAIHLAHDGINSLLFGNLCSISILISVENHVLDSCFLSVSLSCQSNDLLILFDALCFDITFVNIQIQNDLEESFQSGSGTINAIEGIETHWLNTINIECFDFF